MGKSSGSSGRGGRTGRSNSGANGISSDEFARAQTEAIGQNVIRSQVPPKIRKMTMNQLQAERNRLWNIIWEDLGYRSSRSHALSPAQQKQKWVEREIFFRETGSYRW